MGLLSFLLWALLAPLHSLAHTGEYSRVEKILSAREVLITAERREDCAPGRIFAIYPQDDADTEKTAEGDDPEPLGFADSFERYGEKQCLAKVKSHSQSGLIRARDPARPLDLTESGQSIPGRYDLVREGKKEWAAMYKPTVYGGYLFGHTASTLDRGEFLVGLTPVMYGIRNNFQADLTYLRLVENVFEAGLKYKFFSNEDIRLTLRLQNSRFWDTGQDAWSAELHYDSQSNSRSMGHTKLRYSSKVPRDLAFSDAAKKEDSSLELSTVNEWIFTSWHRLLFGPKFVAGDELDLGFLLTFMYVRESFHGALSLNVNSVRKFDFAAYKQTVGFDLFWRL